MKLPVLDAAAKAQLWGLLVSGGVSLLMVYHSDTLGLGPYGIGFALTWALWEIALGRKLAHGPNAVFVGLMSGLAIPWGGVALAWVMAALRP